MRLTQEQFVEKFGDPAKFTFRGQCYDARKPETACICGRQIRFCFLLYSGIEERVLLGSCCFKYFTGTRLADILEASQVYLLNVVLETQKAEKRAAEVQAFRDSRKNWNRLRREALKLIRKHREDTGKKWLPEPLWDVEQAVIAPQPHHKRSSQAAKWFQTKAEYIRKKLEETAPATGTMEHEATAND